MPFLQPNFETDVCIIGGGIAGSYLATLLASRKVQCIIVEEHRDLGKPLQCAGIMSQKLLDLVRFPHSLILNRVKTAQIVSPNHNTILMRGREHPVVIDRIGFDAYFGHQAEQLGVKMLLGEKYLKHWALRDGKAWVQTTTNTIKCKIVVGADGPFSMVAKRFGTKINLIPAIQARVHYNCPNDRTKMYFDPRWKELFGYIIPEGNNICRIGLATKNQPKQKLDTFLQELGIKPEDIIDYQGKGIPFGFPHQIAFRNTVLLGDAGSMVKATTGGGVVMLISAAKILAPALEQAIRIQDYSEKFLTEYYQNPLKHTLGLQLKLHYFIRLILQRLTSEDFERFFTLYQNTNLKLIIGQFADMDFPLLVVLKLLRNPLFIQFLLPILLRNLGLIPQILHDLCL